VAPENGGSDAIRLRPSSNAIPPLGPERGWQLWIDRGGTFTDVVAHRGPLQVRKVLSVQPDRPGDPALAAIREMLGGSG